MTGAQQGSSALGSRHKALPGTLVAWLDRVVRAQPSRPAVVDGHDIWSYSRLWENAEWIAAGLKRDCEVGLGAPVGLVGSNTARYLAAYLGVMRAGAMVVPLNPRNASAELGGQLDLVGASICLVADAEPALTERLREQIELRDVAAWDSGTAGVDPEAAERALCVLTSGSTGEPKGVVHTQATLLHAAIQVQAALPISREDVSMAFLPFFASAPEHALPVLLSGASLMTMPRFDVEQIGAACDEATTFDSVPTIVGRLLEEADHVQLRKLRWMSFASEPMPQAVLERWREEIPTVPAFQFYGLTELLPITHADPELMRRFPGTVGVAYPTSSLRVIDEEDRVLAPGEEGEIVCSSPAQMAGYLNDPEQTALALTGDGAVRTGDVGRLDEYGRLFLTGRLKELIISGGLNISPTEIEAAAFRHPAVAAAAAVGIPDQRWGETPVLVAVPTRGESLTPEELLRHCDEELSSYKRPSAVAVISDLPVIGIGKSAKSVLKKQLLQGELELVHRNGLADTQGQRRDRSPEPACAEAEIGAKPRRSS